MSIVINICLVPAEAVVADISEPKSVVVPSGAPPSELGFRRQLLKDGGEEKVVPPPGRNDESEKLRKSEEEAAEGALLALVNSSPGRKKGRWKIQTIRKLESPPLCITEVAVYVHFCPDSKNICND